MKKFLTLLLAAAMTLSLAACGSKTDDNSGNNSQPASALELLNAVWANYSDDDKFPAAGVGLDMIAIPGDTKATTISGMIADEMALGMVNQKTTAARLIPVIGKGVGDTVEFGGLFGYAPIMPVNQFSCDAFINRGGRIPAPIHSFKN